jgi:DNA-binding beta-propeller fold protein YncE
MEGCGSASRGRTAAAVALAIGCVLLAGCRSPVPFRGRPGPDSPVLGLGGPMPYVRPSVTPPSPPLDRRDGAPVRRAGVYAATRAGMLGPATRRLPPRVYVPVTGRAAIDVIDARRYHVVRRIPVGRAPRQVVPSWDLRTLWVIEAAGLVPIDARTGTTGRTVPVNGPVDLYFSLDGRTALVLGARPGRLQIRDPHTMRLRSVVRLPCPEPAGADLSADGSVLVVGCAGSGRLVLVELRRPSVPRTLRLPAGARPRDVRLSPDGTAFYVADAGRGGVWLVDAEGLRPAGFVATGRGARGLSPSRDAGTLYVTDGAAGTVSLVSFTERRVVGRWRIPAAPDLGGVSADGRVLWLSAPGTDTLFAVSTRTGRILRRLRAGPSPHAPCVFPQPGRFSLGHTGNYR